MMRQKFDQQWSVRKSESTDVERQRIFRLVRQSSLHLDTRLEGPTLLLKDLLKLEEGDVLTFDYPVSRPLNCMVNGKLKYRGHVASTGRKRAFRVSEETSLQT
jgi:flagellar motor switch protein FliM